ncbi:MAG: biotin--[acetyl-CoA-carboxylase] ligase [Flavobacteriales bacterium]|nr:biotin--[acetyl-CoA-carboxylase] ligase [Flavobacteriales bacterium]
MPEPLIIGNTLMEVESCTSTNDLLRETIEKSFQAEGFVLFASHQTAGRGQIGTKWHSHPGESLTFSLWLKPKFLHPSRQFLLNMAISNALIEFMKQHISRISQIKWPNDLYIGNQKSGGILIENFLTQHQISGSIVGIGINLNQTAFPPELPNPVSWKQVTGMSFQPKAVLTQLFSYLNTWYLLLRTGAEQRIKEYYMQHLLGYNCWKYFEDKTEKFEGIIQGVDTAGRLIVAKKSGETCVYQLKEIQFVFEDN